MKISFLIVPMLMLAGSVSAQIESDSTKSQENYPNSSSPPQLWIGHKELSGTILECGFKTERILGSLGFKDLQKSVYETETYIYGNYSNNRAGIHCTSVAGKTFVYGSVAGADAQFVESLRNNIFWKF